MPRRLQRSRRDLFACALAISVLASPVGCRSVSDYEPASLPVMEQVPRLPASGGLTGQAGEPHRVTLDQAIEEALRRGPALRAAAESVVQARADLRTASLLPNPQLNLATTLQPLTTRLTRENPGGPPQYAADVAQPLDSLLFGKRGAAIESARRAVDVAGADLADLARQTRANIAATFFDVLEAGAVLDLARADLEALRNVEALTRRRVELGGSPPIDADRARVAVVSAVQDVRMAETTRVVALGRLRSLLGRSDSEPGFDVDGSLEVAAPTPPPDLEAAMAAAEVSRPDLVSLRRQVQHWEAEARFQRRLALPTLQAQLGYVYQRQEPIGASNLSLWEGSVSVGIPVFDRNQGNVARAESQARQARAGLEVALAGVRADLSQAWASLRAAQAGVADDDLALLEAARSVRERMEAAYQAGGRTILEVLDAERAYRDARRLHVHIQSSYWHALHAFNAAAGASIVK